MNFEMFGEITKSKDPRLKKLGKLIDKASKGYEIKREELDLVELILLELQAEELERIQGSPKVMPKARSKRNRKKLGLRRLRHNRSH